MRHTIMAHGYIAGPFIAGTDDESTQPSTQQLVDPRRLGRNNSGLNDEDISDVMCILHPASMAAIDIVEATAQNSPQHVLQNDGLMAFSGEKKLDKALGEHETFLLDENVGSHDKDLALRFSSRAIQTTLGFCFGRNPRSCDVVLHVDSAKRVSNIHFRIYINRGGVLMLEDMSTNGTLVDQTHLVGKSNPGKPATRMLEGGSVICIPSTKKDEFIKFIVRIPSREGHHLSYRRKFENYMTRVAEAERQVEEWQVNRKHHPPATVHMNMPGPIIPSSTYGMKWDGGSMYNVTGFLGKGAFAIVYQLTTIYDGRHVAAKELEKRRFIKDGRLDQRIETEMQIMKSIRHPNIVEYIEHREENDYLYIIMEYVPCGDLQQYLRDHGTLHESAAKSMAHQILKALLYLHQKRITHRDIKPDNILIASENPFAVKLSDFGLSKVVKNDDTFLKTFCGTLLYCAPEVFPHHSRKRDHAGDGRKDRFHSYNHSVDIWSFAAVLWFALCGSPPFEGVVDTTGRGMYDKIMQTRLDISPLLARGVSEEAIDLLVKMLNRDPAKRPTEVQCLKHPWLFDGSDIKADENLDLNAIQEEDEDGEVQAEAEVLSQLSITDAVAGARADQDAFDEFDLDDLPAEQQKSKRIKIDPVFPRNQARDRSEESSVESAAEMDPSQPHLVRNDQAQGENRRQPRLFGEIGASALASSGVLGERTTLALDMDKPDRNGPPRSSNGRHAARGPEHRSSAAASLQGAESMVRELNMESPNSGGSFDPHSDWDSSLASEESLRVTGSNEPNRQRQFMTQSSDATPRVGQASFGKQFQAPSYESGSLGSQDETPKKAYDRTLQSPAPLSSDEIPPTGMPDAPDGVRARDSLTTSTHVHQMPPAVAEDFRASPARFGTLISTADSAMPLFLKINNRITTWGRDPVNTLVHLDRMERRIPKRAFALFYRAPGIEKTEKDARDWTQLAGLHMLIKACSSVGLLINGVRLWDKGPNGEECCGKVYTGDLITIFEPKDHGSGECLRFRCEFLLGEAARERPVGTPFTVLPPGVKS